MQLQSRGRTKQSTLQAVDVTKEHSAEKHFKGKHIDLIRNTRLKAVPCIALCTCNSLAFTRKSIGHISANRKFRHSPFGTENIRRKHSLILSTLSFFGFGIFRATLKHCTCRHDKTSEHCTCSHDKKLLHSLYTRQNSSVTCAVRTCNAFTATHLHSPSAWTSVQRRPEKQCAQWVHSGRARGQAGKGHSGGGG